MDNEIGYFVKRILNIRKMGREEKYKDAVESVGKVLVTLRTYNNLTSLNGIRRTFSQ